VKKRAAIKTPGYIAGEIAPLVAAVQAAQALHIANGDAHGSSNDRLMKSHDGVKNALSALHQRLAELSLGPALPPVPKGFKPLKVAPKKSRK
jgi:hypothetical protein